jgi:GTP-binding protein YchF
MLSIGIVGLPNVGKSSLFNALTKAENALSANYPFATIDPNQAIIAVPDNKIDELSKISNSKKTIPATIEFYDIAGLVKGAHKGEGLGNQFLSHIRDTNVIVHLVRAFNDDNIIHIPGEVNPKRDIDIINTELILADLSTISKLISGLEKTVKSNPKTKIIITELMDIKNQLDQGVIPDYGQYESEVWHYIKSINLLTAKTMIYVFNTSESDLVSFDGSTYIQKGATCINICVALENEIKDLPSQEALELLDALGLKYSGLERLSAICYDALNLQSFYTTGPEESRAWTIHMGDSAPKAAGVIHTDFENKFIKAEIISYEDFMANGGWMAAKEAGKMRLEGRDYIMQKDDIVIFKHG